MLARKNAPKKQRAHSRFQPAARQLLGTVFLMTYIANSIEYEIEPHMDRVALPMLR